MQIITRSEISEYIDKIKDGAIFIYPTDTIYGIGCDATNDMAVLRLRNIKRQHTRPVSVMVPDKDWIRENCESSEEWLDKLPGPYTLIMEIKGQPVSEHVATESLGVRIPDHWCIEIARQAGTPIVTTSANITGRNFMTALSNLDDEVREQVDFFIDDGEIRGRPSTIVHLDGSVKER